MHGGRRAFLCVIIIRHELAREDSKVSLGMGGSVDVSIGGRYFRLER